MDKKREKEKKEEGKYDIKHFIYYVFKIIV